MLVNFRSFVDVVRVYRNEQVSAHCILIRCFVNRTAQVFGRGEKDTTSLYIVCSVETHFRFFGRLGCLSLLLAAA